jgi:hypothetical protein
MRPVGWTSADAAGLPIAPLLLRPDEILAGSIAHAIRFTTHCTYSYIWPGSHDAGLCGSAYPPMGARFRLRAGFDISGFSANTQVVLRAFQHYGLLLADNGSDWYFQGSTDNWWGTAAGGTVISELKTIPANQFDAVDESDMQAANGSYAALSCTRTPLFTSYFTWFDKASPGMSNDNIHLLNTGGAPSTGCVSLGGVSIPFSVAAGQETYISFPAGSIGGPVVVTVLSGPAVLASQRVQYYQSFNEVWAKDASAAATSSYFNWFDKASPGMFNDNIHLLNPGSSSANVTVSLPGATSQLATVAAGAEAYVSFPAGTIGGPVSVSSSLPVLASQRVQYYSTFNEVWAGTAAQAATTGYFNWFDKASPGMFNDNIHLLNPGGVSATVTVSLPGAPAQMATVAPGAEAFVTFPAGRIGGPVTVRSTQPVLTSQRVQYYSSFNEVWAAGAGQAASSSYFNWFDKASPGMFNDNVHLFNPGAASATVNVSLPGATTQTATVAPGAEAFVTFPAGTIGGPVAVSSSQPVLASQRVQYYTSFNEVPAA